MLCNQYFFIINFPAFFCVSSSLFPSSLDHIIQVHLPFSLGGTPFLCPFRTFSYTNAQTHPHHTVINSLSLLHPRSKTKTKTKNKSRSKSKSKSKSRCQLHTFLLQRHIHTHTHMYIYIHTHTHTHTYMRIHCTPLLFMLSFWIHNIILTFVFLSFSLSVFLCFFLSFSLSFFLYILFCLFLLSIFLPSFHSTRFYSFLSF